MRIDAIQTASPEKIEINYLGPAVVLTPYNDARGKTRKINKQSRKSNKRHSSQDRRQPCHERSEDQGYESSSTVGSRSSVDERLVFSSAAAQSCNKTSSFEESCSSIACTIIHSTAADSRQYTVDTVVEVGQPPRETCPRRRRTRLVRGERNHHAVKLTQESQQIHRRGRSRGITKTTNSSRRRVTETEESLTNSDEMSSSQVKLEPMSNNIEVINSKSSISKRFSAGPKGKQHKRTGSHSSQITNKSSSSSSLSLIASLKRSFSIKPRSTSKDVRE